MMPLPDDISSLAAVFRHFGQFLRGGRFRYVGSVLGFRRFLGQRRRTAGHIRNASNCRFQLGEQGLDEKRVGAGHLRRLPGCEGWRRNASSSGVGRNVVVRPVAPT